MTKKGIKTYFFSFPLLILVIILFPLDNVWSAGLFVKPNGGGSSCTQSFPCLYTTALAKASPRDNIFFSHGEYKRNDNSVVNIEKDIFLYGGWDGSPSGSPLVNPELYPTILDGENLRPVVLILGLIKTTISGFTIQNGNANATVVCEGAMNTGCGGGIYAAEAEVLMEHLVIPPCRTISLPGAELHTRWSYPVRVQLPN